MELFFLMVVVGVVYAVSTAVVLSEIKSNHPEYYEGMNNWGFRNDHNMGAWQFTKFILFYREKIEDPVAYICCWLCLVSMVFSILFAVWLVYGIFNAAHG